MRQSKLFTKTRKESPKDEVSLNAQLLIQAGFINKEIAGVYSYLPLGLRVLKKIERIVRNEMDAIGGQEILMSTLQEKEVWEKTNRWNDEVVDNWFKTTLKNGTELGLAFTHEEPTTRMMKNFISSYKDLPVYVYDVRTVFRNEARAKSGIMRGREFFWKALYSFSRNEEEHNNYYEKAKNAYKNIFKQVGLGDKTYLTFASGGSFSKYSYEFQTISKAGEDTIYINKEREIAINKEVYTNEVLNDLDLKKEELIEEKAIEVGNIFSLGTKFSSALDLKYLDEKGKEQFVYMGSYGIGISRLMGVIAEIYNDKKGLAWPESVAPFKVHLVSLNKNEEAEKIYQDFKKAHIEVLFDDREDSSPGEKLKDVDLIGCPYRIIVSEKTLKEKSVELKKRFEEKTELIKIEKLINYFHKKINL